jgi:hypothetical protein
MTAAAPAKRPARLDGRLSDDGGSARRREQVASKQAYNEQPGELSRLGSATARRPGPQHGDGGSWCSPALRTRRRGGGDEQRGMAWSRGSRATRSLASIATSSLCCSPAPWRSGEAVLKSPGGDGCRTGDGGGLVGAEGVEVGRASSFHGRLRLQGERQLQRPSRSTRGTPVRQPRLQAGRRPVGPAVRRRRASPVRLPDSPRLWLLLLPLFFSLRWIGRNPHGRRCGTGRIGWGGFL